MSFTAQSGPQSGPHSGSHACTPSQTVGPFFSLGLGPWYRDELGNLRASGRTHVRGRVLDAEGQPIPDAVLELWQADLNGRYAHGRDPRNNPDFCGFGRVATDAGGGFRFSTTKPGQVPGPNSMLLQAPHLNVLVSMRGLLKPVRTRMYFPNEASNAHDPVLALVPETRRASLIASIEPEALRWDIRMRGPLETVFFEY